MAGAVALVSAAFAAGATEPETAGDNLAAAFAKPPVESQSWCWWRWLNGAVSKEGITLDLEAMRDKGIGGAVVFDSGDAGTDLHPAAARMTTSLLEDVVTRGTAARAREFGLMGKGGGKTGTTNNVSDRSRSPER